MAYKDIEKGGIDKLGISFKIPLSPEAMAAVNRIEGMMESYGVYYAVKGKESMLSLICLNEGDATSSAQEKISSPTKRIGIPGGNTMLLYDGGFGFEIKMPAEILGYISKMLAAGSADINMSISSSEPVISVSIDCKAIGLPGTAPVAEVKKGTEPQYDEIKKFLKSDRMT